VTYITRKTNTKKKNKMNHLKHVHCDNIPTLLFHDQC